MVRIATHDPASPKCRFPYSPEVSRWQQGPWKSRIPVLRSVRLPPEISVSPGTWVEEVRMWASPPHPAKADE